MIYPKNQLIFSKKTVSEKTKKNFCLNWQKVGNYFKKCCFLGNVVLLKYTEINHEK